MIANLGKISELLNEEVKSSPERGIGYRQGLVEAAVQLARFEEEHRIKGTNINVNFNAVFETLGRTIDLPEEDLD
jgi:hypothetical protein